MSTGIAEVEDLYEHLTCGLVTIPNVTIESRKVNVI